MTREKAVRYRFLYIIYECGVAVKFLFGIGGGRKGIRRACAPGRYVWRSAKTMCARQWRRQESIPLRRRRRRRRRSHSVVVSSLSRARTSTRQIAARPLTSRPRNRSRTSPHPRRTAIDAANANFQLYVKR